MNSGLRSIGRHAQMMPVLASTRVQIDLGMKAPGGVSVFDLVIGQSFNVHVASALLAIDEVTAVNRKMLVTTTLEDHQYYNNLARTSQLTNHQERM